MKTLIPFSNRIILVVAVLLISLSSCNAPEDKEALVKEETIEKVKVMPLSIQSVDKSYEFTATLQANEEVYYAPASPGRIDKINVEIGSRFKEGDLLLVMDQTQLHQARVQLSNLEVDMARFDTLIKANSIPQQQYDQLKTQLEIARTNVKFLEENSRLRAPFSGIVSGKYFENGELYSGAPNTPVGKAAVISLVQINPLKAVVSITEQLYPVIKENMSVSVVTDIFPDKPVTGKVINIYPTIDQLSRTFQVEISIPNPKELLRPGMFCRTTFDAGNVDAFLVPTLAVLKVQGSNERFIFIEKNGKAQRISVLIGRRFDDKVELISDKLNAGDRIIITGQARLVDGVEVEVIK